MSKKTTKVWNTAVSRETNIDHNIILLFFVYTKAYGMICVICQSCTQVEGLLLVVINSSHLTTQRKDFERLMGRTLELVNEQTSCHQTIAESLTELKVNYLKLR